MKTNLIKSNIHDIFARMLYMSNPLVASKKRTITCGKCGEIGHGAKSKVYNGHSNGAENMVIDEDEVLLRDIRKK